MTSSGLIVAAAVLVIGAAVGLWRRRTDGRLHSVGSAAAAPGAAVVGSVASGPSVVLGPSTVVGPSAVLGPSVVVEPSVVVGRETAVDRPVGSDGTIAIAGLPDPIAGFPEPGAGDAPTAGVAADPSAAGERIDVGLLAELGVEPAAATLLQFSSAFCAPCRALRRVSAEVAALLPDVRHVEVDAESHLDAVRALGIWRTPTLLVLDADGRVVKRATGVPGKPQLIAVLGEILPAV
jgi:thiol-disulfide isomerase/thioredoxin